MKPKIVTLALIPTARVTTTAKASTGRRDIASRACRRCCPSASRRGREVGAGLMGSSWRYCQNSQSLRPGATIRNSKDLYGMQGCFLYVGVRPLRQEAPEPLGRGQWQLLQCLGE